jgi:hypothetical protein
MINSVGSGSVSSMLDPRARTAENGEKTAERKTVADHVAEADPAAPIRSASSTQGTLVDTYL